MTVSYNSGTNTITITGTETPASLYAADVAGSWGVVSRIGEGAYDGDPLMENYNYAVNATVLFGDNSTATNFTVTGGSFTVLSAANRVVRFRSNATFQAGQLASGNPTRVADIKFLLQGGHLVGNGGTYIQCGGSFYSNGLIDAGNNTTWTFKYCNIRALDSFAGIDANKASFDYCYIYNSAAVGVKVFSAFASFVGNTIASNTYAVQPTSNATSILRNLVLLNNTYDVVMTAEGANSIVRLIDPSKKDLTIQRFNGLNNITAFVEFTLSLQSLKAADSTGLSNTRIWIRNQQLEVVHNALVGGTVVTTEIRYKKWYDNGSSALEMTYSAHILRARNYGYVEINLQFEATQKLAPSLLFSVNPLIVAATNTAALAVANPNTLQAIYDYCQAHLGQSANIQYPDFFVGSAGTIDCLYNFVIDTAASAIGINHSTGTLTVSGRAATSNFTRFRLAPNKNVVLAQAGTYAVPTIIQSGSIVNVASGTAVLSGWTFASGTVINNFSTGAAIVLVDYAQISNITTTSTGGGSISVRSAPVTFTGFPTAVNGNGLAPASTFAIQDVTSGVWTTYDASSGSVSVSLSTIATGANLVIRADALGWYRTVDSTIAATYTGIFDFTNLFREITDQDGAAIVGLGIQAEKNRVTYNQSATRFELDGGAISFNSALDKKEEITSSQTGLTIFNSALIRQLIFSKNAYANVVQVPAPITIAGTAATATSPVLTDFICVRAGNLSADVFEHGLASTATGLTDRPEVRENVTKFISQSAVQIRQEFDSNSTKLEAVKVKTDQLAFTSGDVKATLDGEKVVVSAIDANVITSASIATDAFDADAIAASAVAEIQAGLSTYNGSDTSGVTTLLSRLTSGRAGNLDNLNATVNSRATPADVQVMVSGGFTSSDRSALLAIPANPLLAANYTAPDNTGISTLLGRLTPARAGYIDKLNVSGALAHSDAANLYKADVSALPTIVGHLTEIKGATFTGSTDSLEAIRDRGDAAWITATGFSTFNPSTQAVTISNASRDAIVTAVDTILADNFAAIPTPPTVAQIWGAATSGLTGVGTIGKLLVDNNAATSKLVTLSGFGSVSVSAKAPQIGTPGHRTIAGGSSQTWTVAEDGTETLTPNS